MSFLRLPITKNVWAVWDYEALPCRTSTNFKTRTNDEYTTKPHIAYTDEDEDDQNVFLSEISYVHQLQNLYFALTNQELTIK